MNDADTAEDEMRRKKLYNNHKKYPKFDKELYCLTFNEVIKGKGIQCLHKATNREKTNAVMVHGLHFDYKEHMNVFNSEGWLEYKDKGAYIMCSLELYILFEIKVNIKDNSISVKPI